MDKIFSLIDNRVKEEIEKINSQKEKELVLLKEKYQDLCKQGREGVKASAKNALQNRLQEKQQICLQEQSFALLKEKQALIERVFEKVKEKITALESKDFERFVLHIISALPKEAKGEMIAGVKTAAVLKRAGFSKIESGLKEEGFIFKTASFELDFSLEQIIDNSKGELKAKAAEILFS